MLHTSLVLAVLSTVLLMASPTIAQADIRFDPDTNNVVLELAGTAFWNNAYYVDAVGDYAFVTMDFGLMIVDVSDKTDPQVASRLYMPKATSRLQIQGDYAFICGGGDMSTGTDWATMTIVDVSDVHNPFVVACYQDPDSAIARGIQVDGFFVYLIDPEAVHIIWVATITNPYELSSFTTWGGNDIEFSNDTLFAVSPHLFFGVDVIDYYNPHGALAAVNTTTGRANGIEIANNLVYLANGFKGLTIIDPYNDPPYLLSHFPLDTGYWSWGLSLDLALVDDTIVYIGGELSNSAKVLNVADPYAVDSIGKCGGNGNYARGMDFDNDYLYVTRFEDGLFINNATDRANPVEVGSFRECQDEPKDIEVRGTTGYLLFQDTIRIVNMSDPANITQIGWAEIGVNSSLAITGDLMLVGNTLGVNAIDVSNPAAPSYLDTLWTDYKYVHSIEVKGDYAYITMWRHGFGIVDISDPSNMVMTSSFVDSAYWPSQNISGAQGWVVINDDYALACYYSNVTLDAGFLVFDVSDPSNLQPVGRHVVGSNQITAYSVKDSLLYFSHLASDSMFVWNISNLLSPVPVTAWRPPEYQSFYPNMIAHAGPYILVNERYSYNTIVIDPSVWFRGVGDGIVATFANHRQATDMVAVGNRIYVASYAGLEVLTLGLEFVCGDINDDGGLGPDVADLTYLVDYLFNGGPPPQDPEAADIAGNDGQVNVADLTYLVDYLFRGGPAPYCG